MKPKNELNLNDFTLKHKQFKPIRIEQIIAGNVYFNQI